MNSIILVIAATVLFGTRIAYLYYVRNKSVNLFPVEAGPLEDVKEDFSKKEKVCLGKVADELNPQLEHFVVRNECMTPRGIMSGDVIGVRLFDGSFTLADTNEDDVLLIYLDDERFKGHKIRIRGEMNNVSKECNTYYFAGRRKVLSRHPHTFNKIKGVVEDVYHLS